MCYNIIKNSNCGGLTMDYKEMLKSARINLNGSCRVCKTCNGVVCSG